MMLVQVLRLLAWALFRLLSVVLAGPLAIAVLGAWFTTPKPPRPA